MMYCSKLNTVDDCSHILVILTMKRGLMHNSVKLLILSGVMAGLSACTVVTDFTSSTSSTLDAVTPDITLNRFIDQRYVAIRKDAATGSGENLDALAELMGQADKQEFASWMQDNYDNLFTDLDKPSDLAARIGQYRSLDKG